MINKISTLIFDWGGTLMSLTPSYSGKMRDWPVVQATEKASECLAKLSKSYQIVIATNAQESSAEDVRAALARVDLHRHFQMIFTSQELGVLKSEPGFYLELCSKLTANPTNCMMVGDNYQNDILPAWKAGLQTIWFNPDNQVAQAHLPLQTMECSSLVQIPELLKLYPLPSYQDCLTWYFQQGATHTLIAHVSTVAAASYQMAIWFRKAGVSVSALLTHRGGFLHDLSKLRANAGESHAESAAKLLYSYQQPKIAEIARRHLIGNLVDIRSQPQSWEEKIVNYCDKLAEGSQLVSLDERLFALKSRYPNFAEKITRNTPQVKKLEDEILAVLNLTSKELLIKLQEALYSGQQ